MPLSPEERDFFNSQNGWTRRSAPTESESFKLENSPFPVGRQPSRAEFILPPSHQGESHSARRLTSLSPSSVESDPQSGTTHFPAFAVKAYLAKCARIPARKASVLIDAGRKKMERAIRIRPALRVRSAARAHTPSRNGSAPADSGFRTGASPRSCGARALRRPGDGGRALTPRLVREFLKNTINIDKFTGFFDKKVKNYFIDLQGVMDFRSRFPANFGTKKIQELCKIQAGYFSTRRFAITIRWMSFVPSPTCKRMESR